MRLGMKKSRITKDKILNIVEKHSVFYCNRFSYRDGHTRKLIKKMKSEGIVRVAVCKSHKDLLVVLKGKSWQSVKMQG